MRTIKLAISYSKRNEIAIGAFSHPIEFAIALWPGHELAFLQLSVLRFYLHYARLVRV